MALKILKIIGSVVIIACAVLFLIKSKKGIEKNKETESDDRMLYSADLTVRSYTLFILLMFIAVLLLASALSWI
jgi:hypothetical protein